MVSHIAGEGRAPLRVVLGAPEKAAFANEIITAGKDGGRTERWIFLDDDGVEVGRREVATTSFDPQQRPWYGPARSSDLAQRSDLYIFASNNEPGFSLSRRFTAAMPGVLGADLAASDLSDFLSKQRVTPTSVSFIFTRSDEIVAFPHKARVAALVPRTGEMMVPLPKLTALNEPAAAGLFAAYQAERRLRNPRLRRRRPDLYRPDHRDCSPVRARSTVGDRRADRRHRAADHRTAQPDAVLLDRRSGLRAAALRDPDRRLDRSTAWAQPPAVSRNGE
jgi:hypothetical protein